jgi:hypothetical protein
VPPQIVRTHCFTAELCSFLYLVSPFLVARHFNDLAAHGEAVDLHKNNALKGIKELILQRSEVFTQAVI